MRPGRYAVQDRFGATAMYVNDDTHGLRRLGPNGLTPSGRRLSNRQEIIAAIDADEIGAAIAYAEHSGRCFVCGRQLSREESVARSIGPDCLETHGPTFTFDELERLGVELARAKGLAHKRVA